MDKNFFIETFIEFLGPPDDSGLLEQYIDFVLNYDTIIAESDYSEVHHILPRKQFPHLIKEKFNLVRLKYCDHVYVHELLADAYSSNFALCYALKWMKGEEYKNSKEYKQKLSAYMGKISKDWWNHIKENDPEEYTRICNNKSKIMKDWQASYMANKFYNEHDGRKFMSNHFKNMWKNEEKRKQIILSMIKERNTPEGKARMRKAVQKKWDEMDNKSRQKFQKKMSVINKDPEKRNKASNAIKLKWKEPEFREKMENRKHGSNSQKMKQLWGDPDHKENILLQRKNKYLLRNKIALPDDWNHDDLKWCKEKYPHYFMKSIELNMIIRSKGIKVPYSIKFKDSIELFKTKVLI